MRNHAKSTLKSSGLCSQTIMRDTHDVHKVPRCTVQCFTLMQHHCVKSQQRSQIVQNTDEPSKPRHWTNVS